MSAASDKPKTGSRLYRPALETELRAHVGAECARTGVVNRPEVMRRQDQAVAANAAFVAAAEAAGMPPRIFRDALASDPTKLSTPETAQARRDVVVDSLRTPLGGRSDAAVAARVKATNTHLVANPALNDGLVKRAAGWVPSVVQWAADQAEASASPFTGKRGRFR